MTPQEIAADIAKELKEHPERWCKGLFAKAKDGYSIFPRSPDAVTWCLVGHIHRRAEGLLTYQTQFLFSQELGGSTVLEWNDAPNRKVGSVIKLCEQVAKS